MFRGAGLGGHERIGDRIRHAASHKRSLLFLALTATKSVSPLVSVIYNWIRGGDWPANLYRIMCSTSICLDQATRSALLMRARKGDRESLARLTLPYAPILYLRALRLTRNLVDPKDVPHDAFLKPNTRLRQFFCNTVEHQHHLHAVLTRTPPN